MRIDSVMDRFFSHRHYAFPNLLVIAGFGYICSILRLEWNIFLHAHLMHCITVCSLHGRTFRRMPPKRYRGKAMTTRPIVSWVSRLKLFRS